jgi:hypothetical protein
MRAVSSEYQWAA